jgi:hypothetical protein
MLGDGGSSPDMVDGLMYLNRVYGELIDSGAAEPEDGPDDVLIRTVGGYIVLSVELVEV